MGPGFDEWLAAQRSDNYDQQEDLAFLLQSLAAARHRDQMVQREIALLNLKLQAVAAGVTSLWEVSLYPPVGHGGRPVWVVVPGRNSDQAAVAALRSGLDSWSGRFAGLATDEIGAALHGSVSRVSRLSPWEPLR